MAMQGLRRELAQRADRIRRGGMLASLTIGPVQRGQFIITATWGNKDGSTGKYVRTMTKDEAFRYNGPRGVQLKKRPCRVADDIILTVLRMRGIR